MTETAKKRRQTKQNDEMITVTMTLDQAKKLGIVFCKNCSHPWNNHFEWDEQPCTRCECRCYVQDIFLPK